MPTILIVEDEAKMRRLLELNLGEDGFTVESLHHWEGEAALRKLREAGAFFVGGGETFLLLRTLLESGQPLRGVSAGSVNAYGKACSGRSLSSRRMGRIVVQRWPVDRPAESL